jgi:hypothetical protein
VTVSVATSDHQVIVFTSKVFVFVFYLTVSGPVSPSPAIFPGGKPGVSRIPRLSVDSQFFSTWNDR